MDITKLYFGKAAAENEVASNPDRFLKTYLDRWNLPQEVAHHEKFLILGPKGSGKSAAAHHVALKWEQSRGKSGVFTDSVDFDELNRTQSPLYQLDKKLVSNEVSALTDAAWKLFIGIRLLDSLLSDNACNLTRDPQVLKFLDQLRSAGLASDDYPQVLRRVKERKGGIRVPSLFGELTSKDSESLSPGQIGDAILNMIAKAETPNRHLLSIDGLDKAIGENEAYWRTLAALIRVGDAMSRRLRQQGNDNVYVMIMCRSDVFRRINFADAPKIAADSGIQMEWGAEAQDPRDVLLWEYVATKAGVDIDQLMSLLPDFVEVGDGRKIQTPKYILDFTRYTPRDMTLLFKSVQSRANTYRPVTGQQLRSGADNFASHHLLYEIKSEAAGLLPQVAIDRLEQIVSTLPARVFSKNMLEQKMTNAELSGEISTEEFGEYLFLQGAMGNYRQDSRYIQFYHRRNSVGFDPYGPWILHTGLEYALNVPFSSGNSSPASARQ